VVAALYPLQYVAERVVGEHAEVQNLTSPGVEPHDLELSVQQTAAIAEADVAFYEAGFQPAVDDTIEQSGPEHVVEVTEIVPLATVEEHHEHHETGHGTGHGDSSQGDGAHADEGHDHDGQGDPHVWQDPELLAEIAAAFTAEMATVDPDNAADYRANLRALRADLTELDRDFEAGLADCARDTVVVSHDAFGYLEKYGVHFESIIGLSPDAEPSPDHLARLHELVRAEGITTVFSETLASRELAGALADDLGLRTAVLDAVEGLTDSTADEDYLSLMRANLAALREASDCR